MAISKAPAFDLGLRGVQFGYRSTELTKEAKGILKENAKVLLAQSRALVQLDGHCDQRGQRDFNFKLGDRRARVVLEFLVAQGVERDRLLTLSYGFERPLDRAMNEEAFRRNRRVEFVVVSK